MFRARRFTAGAALAGALAMAVAGCGGGGGGNASAGGSSGGSGGESGKAPIKIGVVLSLTGPYSVLGGFVKNTAGLMAKQLNASGGIDGRQLQMVYKDDQTDPTQAVTAVRELVRDPDVAAIMGPISSSSCAAVVDQIETAKMPTVTDCASESQVEPVRSYVFMSTLSTKAQVEQLLSYLDANGKNKVALLVDDTDFGAAGKEAVSKAAAAHHIDVIRNDTYSLKGTTFVSQLTAADRAHPDAVVVWGAGPPLVTIAKEYQQLGFKEPLVFSAAAATPLFLAPAGKAANGVTMASSVANVIDAASDSNPSKALVEKIAADYKQAYNEPISQFTADVCGAFRIITNAIEKAGGTDHQKVRDAIEANSVVGCHGTYDYSATDHRGLPASVVVVATAKDGKLAPTKYSEAKLQGGS